MSPKPSPPATNLWCFPFKEVGVRWRPGRYMALQLRYREERQQTQSEQGRKDGAPFYHVKTYLSFPGAQGPRSQQLCSLHVYLWKCKAQRGAVIPKVVQQIWVPPHAH